MIIYKLYIGLTEKNISFSQIYNLSIINRTENTSIFPFYLIYPWKDHNNNSLLIFYKILLNKLVLIGFSKITKTKIKLKWIQKLKIFNFYFFYFPDFIPKENFNFPPLKFRREF
jgi:hypothetical protein